MVSGKRGFRRFFYASQTIKRENLSVILDKFASRYGWTFSYIYSLEFMEFLEAIEMLNKGLESDFKDEMTLQAFGSWQIIEALRGMLGGNKQNQMPFEKYAKSLGLLNKSNSKEEDNEFKKRQREIEKQKALQTAQEILRIDRQG